MKLKFALIAFIWAWGLNQSVYAVEAMLDSPPLEKIGEKYKVKFGFARPNFSNYLYYDDLYGGTSNYINLKVDQYFGTRAFSFPIGLQVGLGYYSDEGNPTSVRSPSNGQHFSDDEIDYNQKLILTLVPIELNAVSQWHLFKNFLVWDFWGGLEYLVVQETRTSADTESKSDGSKNFVNYGQERSFVFGTGLGIRIDKVGGTSAWSLQSLGFGAIYVQPYLEIVKASTKRMGDFSRSVVGLMMSFESI